MARLDPYNCQHDADQERAELIEEVQRHEEKTCNGYPYCLFCIADARDEFGSYDWWNRWGPR